MLILWRTGPSIYRMTLVVVVDVIVSVSFVVVAAAAAAAFKVATDTC